MTLLVISLGLQAVGIYFLMCLTISPDCLDDAASVSLHSLRNTAVSQNSTQAHMCTSANEETLFNKSMRLEVSVALKRAVGFWFVRSERQAERFLSSEAVESAALALEGVDDVHGGDRLSLSVLAVRDGVTDHVLKDLKTIPFINCNRKRSFCPQTRKERAPTVLLIRSNNRKKLTSLCREKTAVSLGRTLPWAIVTPASSLFSSSSLRTAGYRWRELILVFLLSRAALPASSRTSAAT